MDGANEFFSEIVSTLSGLDQRAINTFFAIGAFLVVVAVVASLRRRGRLRSLPRTAPVLDNYEHTLAPPVTPDPPPPDPRLALMVEKAELTGFGGFCAALVIVNWLIALVVFVGAKSVMHEILAALIWIGGTAMFGLGALMNVRRRYTILRP